MKLLVETTGPFMLIDSYTKCEIDNNRPSVVLPSEFIQARMTVGQLRVISNELSDGATDEEFAQFWRDSGKRDLAISSFLSKFGPTEGGAPKVAEQKKVVHKAKKQAQ